MCADRDIEAAADLAALCPGCGGLGWRFYAPGDEAPCDICGGGGLADELTPALMERDALDGTAKGPLTWDHVADAVWDDHENDAEIRNVCPQCDGNRWLIGGRGQLSYDCPGCDGTGVIE